MPFSIDQDKQELTCTKCNSTHSLEKEGSFCDYCKCFNIRLVRCKLELHISLIKENESFWYEYTVIKKKT